MKLLSQLEVDILPVGTRVRVKWSGGNGPHEYTIVDHQYGHSVVDNTYKDSLKFVGKERYHDQVEVKE